MGNCVRNVARRTTSAPSWRSLGIWAKALNLVPTRPSVRSTQPHALRSCKYTQLVETGQ